MTRKCCLASGRSRVKEWCTVSHACWPGSDLIGHSWPPVKVVVYAGAEEEPPAQLGCSNFDKTEMVSRSALCPASWPAIVEQKTKVGTAKELLVDRVLPWSIHRGMREAVSGPLCTKLHFLGFCLGLSSLWRGYKGWSYGTRAPLLVEDC